MPPAALRRPRTAWSLAEQRRVRPQWSLRDGIPVLAVVAALVAECGLAANEDVAALTTGGCKCMPATLDYTILLGPRQWSWCCGDAGWCDVQPGCTGARDATAEYSGWDRCERSCPVTPPVRPEGLTWSHSDAEDDVSEEQEEQEEQAGQKDPEVATRKGLAESESCWCRGTSLGSLLYDLGAGVRPGIAAQNTSQGHEAAAAPTAQPRIQRVGGVVKATQAAANGCQA